MKNSFKRKRERVRGDIIEIRLKDNSLNPYFKDSAHINNKKEMLNLLSNLKEKGVSFPSSWF